MKKNYFFNWMFSIRGIEVKKPPLLKIRDKQGGVLKKPKNDPKFFRLRRNVKGPPFAKIVSLFKNPPPLLKIRD